MSTKRTKRRDPESHVPMGRPNPRTLAQFRREVVALMRTSHRIPSETSIRVIAQNNDWVTHAWRNRKAPCYVSDQLARKVRSPRTARDAENPEPGEVYQSKAGAQWTVQSFNRERRRVKVRRTAFKDLGELEWNPSVLRSMALVQKQVAEMLRQQESEVAAARPLEGRSEEERNQANWFIRTFGRRTEGDPDRRYYVYVIESVRNGHRVLYVGQSAHRPAERLKQHKRGAAYCKGCTKRRYAKGSHMRLVPEFYRGIPTIRSRKRAEAVERLLARKLRQLGFTVEGGH